MNKKTNFIRIISKGLIFLGYLIFSLVQLNIHFNGASRTISYFSNGYNLEKSGESFSGAGQYTVHKATGKEDKKISFRLNKRFYPQYFKVSEVSILDRESCYSEFAYPRMQIDPSADLHFFSYGLRGPPAIV